MRNRGFLFAFYGSFKHTVVFKKTLDVLEKTLDYIRKNEMYISGKTKCIYFMQKRNVHKIKEK